MRSRQHSARAGFTLAEALVALALAGLVLLPATLAFHQLLRADARLRGTLRADLTAREVLETTAMDVACGLTPTETRVFYTPNGGLRVVVRHEPPDGVEPAHLTVEAAPAGDMAAPRRLALVLPPPPPAPAAPMLLPSPPRP